MGASFGVAPVTQSTAGENNPSSGATCSPRPVWSFPAKLSPLVLLAAVSLAGWLHPDNLLAASTITYVQSNYSTPQTPQTAVNVTFSAAQAAGDLNVVAVGWNDSTAAVSALTDSSGNTYTRAVGPTAVSGYLSQSIYYAKNIAAAAAGANTVTVTFSVAAVSPTFGFWSTAGPTRITRST
jgi:hypothetical protein